MLHELYAEMATAAGQVDLDAIWRRLGVSLRGTEAVFDDEAPLAPARDAITRAPAHP